MSAVFSGALSTMDHAEKLRGFAGTLAMQASHLTLLPVLESHERKREAYRQALSLMKGKSQPQGLYISTANSIPVMRALEERRLLGKVQVVTTDLFQELVPLIQSGKILASLYQRPFTQGRIALENLLSFLLKKSTAQTTVRLAPHVIFRSNISLFFEQITGTDQALEEEDVL